MRSEEIAAMRNILRQKLIDLTRETRLRLDGMRHPDVTNQASEESQRTFLLLLHERRRRLEAEILDALDRLERGEYGACVECGEEIGLARLKARPTAELCIHCQSLRENGSATFFGFEAQEPLAV